MAAAASRACLREKPTSWLLGRVLGDSAAALPTGERPYRKLLERHTTVRPNRRRGRQPAHDEGPTVEGGRNAPDGRRRRSSGATCSRSRQARSRLRHRQGSRWWAHRAASRRRRDVARRRRHPPEKRYEQTRWSLRDLAGARRIRRRSGPHRRNKDRRRCRRSNDGSRGSGSTCRGSGGNHQEVTRQ